MNDLIQNAKNFYNRFPWMYKTYGPGFCGFVIFINQHDQKKKVVHSIKSGPPQYIGLGPPENPRKFNRPEKNSRKNQSACTKSGRGTFFCGRIRPKNKNDLNVVLKLVFYNIIKALLALSAIVCECE